MDTPPQLTVYSCPEAYSGDEDDRHRQGRRNRPMTHTDDKAEPRFAANAIVAEWLTELWVKRPQWLARMPDREDLDLLISKITALPGPSHIAEPRRELIARDVREMTVELWRLRNDYFDKFGLPGHTNREDALHEYLWANKTLICTALSTRPAQGDKTEALQDSAYIAGMSEGFRLGLDENHEGLAKRITARDGYLASITRLGYVLTPEPQIESTTLVQQIDPYTVEKCAEVAESYNNKHWLQAPSETIREIKAMDIAAAIRSLTTKDVQASDDV